jgi:sodium-dependent dicarboxylate transporter 2/3/5
MGIMSEYGIKAIPFAQWMWMVAPLVFMMFIIVGIVLSLGLKDIHIDTNLATTPLDRDQKKVLIVIFGLILLLLVNAPIKPYYDGLGLSEPGILLGAGLILFAPPFSLLDWMGDKDNIPYRIMFLFGAGFAIAAAFTKTGLASEIASHLISFSSMPLILFLLIIAVMVTFTTELTSNTALISIMLPILYEVAHKTGINATLIMMVATICASYAFMLPIATPPNAIAMSSGVVSVKTMATYGFVFNIFGIILILLIANTLWINIL